MNYALIKNGVVESVIVADEEFVKALSDYDYIISVDDFETPIGTGWSYINGVFTAPIIVKSEIEMISMRQLRLALLKFGKLSEVTMLLNALDSPLKEELEIEWSYAQIVHRNGFIQHITQKLKLDIDELFNLAATL